MTNKWSMIVDHYVKIKQKKNASFKTFEELFEAFQVHRKDIRKYYERWAEMLLKKHNLTRQAGFKILCTFDY